MADIIKRGLHNPSGVLIEFRLKGYNILHTIPRVVDVESLVSLHVVA